MPKNQKLPEWTKSRKLRATPGVIVRTNPVKGAKNERLETFFDDMIGTFRLVVCHEKRGGVLETIVGEMHLIQSGSRRGLQPILLGLHDVPPIWQENIHAVCPVRAKTMEQLYNEDWTSFDPHFPRIVAESGCALAQLQTMPGLTGRLDSPDASTASAHNTRL